MIALKSSTSDGSSYEVFDDDEFIGHVHLKESPSGNKYLASIFQGEEEKGVEKEFHSPQDALLWIEQNR
jgi:hypothetical protein